jgi:MFS family permease
VTSAPRPGGLWAFLAVVFVVGAALGSIGALLGRLRDDLGFSNAGAGTAVAAGFLAAFAVQLLVAPQADRGRARLLVLSGLGLGAVAGVLLAVADDLVPFVAARTLLGVASGLILPGVQRIVSNLDPARVGTNLGRLVAAEVAGFVVGPVLAAVVADASTLDAPFWGLAVVLALLVPVVARHARDTGPVRTSGSTAFDLLGNRRLVGGLVLMAGYYVLLGAFESVLPLQYTDLGVGLLGLGIIWGVLGVPIALTAPLGGWTADRFGAVPVALVGMAAVGLVSSLLGVWPSVAVVTALMFVAGIAHGFGNTAAVTVIARAVPEHRRGSAFGLMGAAQLGSAGAVAAPAAWAYGAFGAGPTWVLLAVLMASTLAVGGLLLRSTGQRRTTVGAEP